MAFRDMHDAAIEVAVESLDRAGYLTLRVTGTSMLPAIHPGSQVLVERARLADVRPGDVVLVKRGAGLSLHRLCGMSAAGAITRGDANEEKDPPAAAEQVLGRLISIQSRPSFLVRCRNRLARAAA